eukprot:TRINITY_DN2884_c0_g1_i1.p1 TRINITY_DN2884_c0_g1~~TRINITY_DN2884_c0_g1_i1.p1  ORF type:complete len:664 (+),score=130.79 TRINITY_DN2884_c0_g1_i1:66-2057(+)
MEKDQFEDASRTGQIELITDINKKKKKRSSQQGTVENMDLRSSDDTDFSTDENDPLKAKKPPHKMNQLLATAIAGNDITSSIFYTIGVCTTAAGFLMPISMCLVVLVLYLFRDIYAEVCTALPLNGGTYNVLLNASTKPVAAVAAALSLLSYMATAVVSANTAASYLNSLLNGAIPDSDVKWFLIGVTIMFLAVFAFLNLVGLSESAVVAAIIFIFHISTLVTLIGFSAVQFGMNTTTFLDNIKYRNDVDDINVNSTYAYHAYSPVIAVYLGFSTALLGVSGFETSANYIEEQQDGVYPKTLRNMWALVALLNPALSFLTLCVLSVHEIIADSDSVLTDMASRTAGGSVLKYVVGIDAVIVLSGAVLTAYVGVIGLVRRMSMDRCLPQFLLAQNPYTHTNHWIIILFFFLTSSLVLITMGDVTELEGVYTVAFLTVMTLFALGNVAMKYKRKQLPRFVKAGWIRILLGIAFVVGGLIGNIYFDPIIVAYFAIYFTVVILAIFSMFARIRLLKVLLFMVNDISNFIPIPASWKDTILNWTKSEAQKIKSQSMAFFTKTDQLAQMNKAIQYVLENEITGNLKMVHVYESQDTIPPSLQRNVSMLDETYPKITIDLVLIQGIFSPQLVDSFSERMRIPKNLIFITCPSNKLMYKINEFGGVRVITH